MRDNEKSRACGKLIGANHALPPVQVDCSDWPRSQGPRTSGALVNTNHSLPPVQVGTATVEQAYWEIHLYMAPDVQQEAIALGTAALTARFDSLERGLGGAGLLWDKVRSVSDNGAVKLVLSARDSFGATQRFKQLAGDIGRAIEEQFGPVNIRACAYRLTPSGNRTDDFEINSLPKR